MAQAIGVGSYVRYGIFSQDGEPIEYGIGLLSDSTTLQRTRPSWTFVSGTVDDTAPSAVNLASGTKLVECVATAQSFLPTLPTARESSSNRLLLCAHTIYSSGNFRTMVANRVFYMPWYLASGREIASYGCIVTNLAASTKIRIGSYSVTPAGEIGNLFAEISADIDGGSTGFKTQSLSGGTKFHPPGQYVMACLSNGTPQLAANNANVNTRTGARMWFGTNAAIAVPQGFCNAREDVSSGWTSMPATPGTLTFESEANVFPHILVMVPA